jgi:AAHS family 4-hydroxybenzoate transporter-like MFS transporter
MLPSDYIKRNLYITTSGLPLGGFICGMLSAAIEPVWGWQLVFVLGGIFPLALSFFLIVLLPESVQFLSQRKADPQKIAKLLAPIAPDLGSEIAPEHVEIPRAASEVGHKSMSVKHLFTDGRAMGTVLLWIPNFMNLLLMYVMINWLPILLSAAGMSASDGVTATSFYSLGGIAGTLAEGFLIKYGGSFRILLAQFGLCGLLSAFMAMVVDLWLLVTVMAFLLGFLVIGAQAGLNVLAAQFYPTSIRSTGVGWALGMGRIGSIVGPILAGILRSKGWQPGQVLLAGTIPALFAFASILLGRWASGGHTPYSPKSVSR